MREITVRRGRRMVAGMAGATAGLLGAGLLTAAAVHPGVATATPRGAAVVPWQSVGAGWLLADYSTGTSSRPAATTLELVSPAGVKYPLYTWRKSAVPAPALAAWSPSKTEVLLQVFDRYYRPTGVFDRLDLQTGQLTAVNLGLTTRVVSYTLPTGQQILADEATSSATTWTETVERFTTAGQPVKTLVTAKYSTGDPTPLGPVYAPDGASIALGENYGVAVVSNAGGAVKHLPVPGVDKRLGCTVARWWNSGTILATCAARLWLVPATGAKPKALTPVRGPGGGGPNIDLGDFAAWQLSSGLYLNSYGACGSVVLNRQNPNGSVTTLYLPGLGDPHILTAVGPRLLIDSLSCEGPNFPGGTVAWYNPGTKAEKVLFAKGVFGILPFPSMLNEANVF
jgi:TolB protein